MKLLCRMILAVASLSAMAAPALACSPSYGYRVPTNFELVTQADVILLARIGQGSTESEISADIAGGRYDGWSVTIMPIAALKGELPANPVNIPNAYLATIADDPRAIPSNPYELSEPHPNALMGVCSREAFLPGRTVLFFFSEEEGTLRPLYPPFSRWAEDVPSADAPWMRAVRIYVDAAALPESDQREALIAARDELLTMVDDPDAALIAADINRQLADPNEVLVPYEDDAVAERDYAREAAQDMEAAADDAIREMEQMAQDVEDAVDATMRDMEAALPEQ